MSVTRPHTVVGGGVHLHLKAQHLTLKNDTLLKGRTHIVIGDTQVKKGVTTAHLDWIGEYIVDQFAGRDVTIVHVGDHWDMPSLSSYDKGTKGMEGRRYRDDIESGRDGMVKLTAPLARYNAARRSSSRWHPDQEFFLGNHEDRIERATNADAQLDGVIGYEDFNLKELGWRVHDFRKPAIIDGVHYAHYFYNGNTGRPHSGENLDTRLKTIGHSFTMGHQQGLKYSVRPVGNRRHHGLVNGSCYLHEEKYLGPQTMSYWRGIVVCHQVQHGMYDPMMVSLDYLCRKYERKTLVDFMRKQKH